MLRPAAVALFIATGLPLVAYTGGDVPLLTALGVAALFGVAGALLYGLSEIHADVRAIREHFVSSGYDDDEGDSHREAG